MVRFRSVLFVVAILFFAKFSGAQTIDLYTKLTDPRGISRLDSVDQEPILSRVGVGWPSLRDSTDNFFVLAHDEGPGILTHLWLHFHDVPDSLTRLKLWIDDTLVSNTTLLQFFHRKQGMLRVPLDTMESGGLIGDVQIPYHRNFRLTYFAEWNVCCLFWNIEWRRVSASALPFFQQGNNAALDARLRDAEHAYRANDPWQGEQSFAVDQLRTFAPKESRSIVDLEGPGLLQTLTISAGTTDSLFLEGLRLRIFWDNNPTASVDVPVADFFGMAGGYRETHGLRISCSPDGIMKCTFPMPFAVHARVTLTNENNTDLQVNTHISYSKEPVDRSHQAYFHTSFNVSNPLVQYRAHTLLQTKGRGRYVGTHLAVPGVIEPYFLEGDCYFKADSNLAHRVHYYGCEDYFNGGWFFEDGPFALPFAGASPRFQSFYRYHILDSYDYLQSMEAYVEHGPANEFPATYRTVAFYYELWRPFWTSRDTVTSGETLPIGGSGYSALEAIRITLDGKNDTLVHADAHGAFAIDFLVPQMTLGTHMLAVNDVEDPYPVYFISSPTLRLALDSLIKPLFYRDTLLVYSHGFKPGSVVTLFCDTVRCDTRSPVLVDSNHSFSATMLTPWVENGKYRVIAKNDDGERAASDSLIEITRSESLECEAMWPPSYVDDNAALDYMGYFLTYFSNSVYVRFQPGAIGRALELSFSPILPDTFRVQLFLGKGPRFGQYDIYLDNQKVAWYDGNPDSDRVFRSGPVELGTRFLDNGLHRLKFVMTGTRAKSQEALLGADNLLLIPTTKLSPLPVATTPPVRQLSGGLLEPLLKVYPNPTSSTLNMEVAVASTIVDSGSELKVELIDELGRPARSLYEGRVREWNTKISADLTGLPVGTYYCLIKLSTRIGVGRMIRPVVVSPH